MSKLKTFELFIAESGEPAGEWNTSVEIKAKDAGEAVKKYYKKHPSYCRIDDIQEV